MMAGFIEIVCNIPTSVIGKSMSSNNAKHFDIGVDTLGCGCAKTACGSSRILERMFLLVLVQLLPMEGCGSYHLLVWEE